MFFKTIDIQTKLTVGEKGDKYEQEAEAMADQVVNRVQRVPAFDSDGIDPFTIQGMYREVDERDKVFRSESDQPAGKTIGEMIVAIARSRLGKVRAKQPGGSDGGKQLRFGYDVLLEIFQLAAPGVWSDDVVKYLGPGLPSWCGIFATYCIKKAGINIGNWQMGKGVSAFGTLKVTENPQPGDIGYIDQPYQHHCIIARVEGDTIESIDGNSGWYSEIIETKRPRSAYTGFFTALHNAPDINVRRKEKEEEKDSGSTGLESQLEDSKGSGFTLDEKTRTEMEGNFGADFSNVRVHTGSDAVQMSEQLNAQAFTHGSDIYFNEGKYNPDTSSGKHLLAHELTHTVQQEEGLQKRVQKAGGSNANAAAAKEPIDFDNSTITLPLISLPSAKKRKDNSKLMPPFIYPQGYERKNSYKDIEDESSSKEQREVWKLAVTKGVQSKVNEISGKAKKANAYDKDTLVYYMKHKQGKDMRLIGKPDAISENSYIPTWSRTGKATAFDVDHVRELQLEGKNFHSNMELLHFSLNRASGNSVKNEINNRIIAFIEKEEKKNSTEYQDAKFPKSARAAKDKFTLVFKKVDFTNSPKASGSEHYWSLEEITEGQHLDDFEPMKSADIKKIKGSKGDETIYTSPVGGAALKKKDILSLNNKSKKITFHEPEFIENQTGKQAGELIGSFNVDFGFYGSEDKPKSFKIPILQMDGVPFGGSIPRRGEKGKGGLEQLLVGLEMPGLSPVTVDDAQFTKDKGLAIRGKIHPTLDIIKGFDLDFYMEGDDFNISKTITAEEIKVPPPFKINEALLTIGAGNKGVYVQGDVLFEISKLGTGKISGMGKSNGDFGIKGKFDFDPKLFRKGAASIEVGYNNKDGWSAGGELEIGKGTVKGIKSAKISVVYSKNMLEAAGTAEVEIKGVNEVTLRIKFGEKESEIEGGVKIGKLPGIKDGEGSLKIVKKDNEYDFSGKGKITPDIPGIETQVDFEFANDIFLVNASLDYKRDRLEGKLKLGITNQEMAEGVPTGKKSDNYTVYGGGQISLKITDSLKVTAGVNFLPNGEVEVTGRIDLPKKFKLFPAPLPKREKQLLKIPVNIPTPIPIIQIYVYGYINAEAEIGEGYLDDVFAEVKYNPSHPEEMSITGGMSFKMPAYAEIKAGVEFGIKASLLIASIRGGIDLSAALRLEVPQPILKGELKWSPATGFELDGTAKIGIMPSLIFTGAFKITGEIDLLLGSISKSWSWPFGSMTLSPNAPFGMEFPFKYNKNTPFNLSFDQIKFTYPSVGQLADSLKDSVVNKIYDKLG